jgi:excisionase family DNA binding protein
MTLGEASAFLRVSRCTMKRWDKKGALKAIRLNSRGDRRYKKQDLLTFINLGFQKNDK